MPKLNKPRSAWQPDERTARELLGEFDIDPGEVKDVRHFSDGSMSIVMQRDEDLRHLGVEFDPDLTANLALAFKALGIRVDRSAG